jgi:lactate 2-monooxygenase
LLTRQEYDRLVSFSGASVQNAIYIAGEPPEWPIAAADWERAAEERLDPGAFGYIAGGAGAEETMRANLEAFRARRLRPRMLRGHTTRDLSVEVLGLRSPGPFLLAPIGVLSIAHADGEVGAGAASAATGVPLIVSSAATHSLEQVAATNAPRWFQLYWVSDREICESFVRRAEANGYGAVVVTLDTLTLGWRPRDLRGAYLPFLHGEGCGQFFADPVFRSRLDKPPAEDLLTAAATMLATFTNLGLTWDDLDWLRGLTDLPLLVKGVLTADDAERALEHGMDGVIVSNHGGRQVDGALAALDALVDVRGALPDAVVLMDGGIRTGADVVKAIALGADAVLLGRPYAYALAVGGARGVEVLIEQLLAEVDLTLALLGAGSVGELDGSWLQPSPR